jgi:hypothetical protein
MRRSLVEQARRKRRVKRGGSARRVELAENLAASDDRAGEIVAVHEALDELERHAAQAAALAKLRVFAGFAHQEAADMLGLGRRAADRLWLLARTWLYRTLAEKKSCWFFWNLACRQSRFGARRVDQQLATLPGEEHGRMERQGKRPLPASCRNRRTRRAPAVSGDEPVESCPPSAAYRLRKLSRKYRTPLAVAGAVVQCGRRA